MGWLFCVLIFPPDVSDTFENTLRISLSQSLYSLFTITITLSVSSSHEDYLHGGSHMIKSHLFARCHVNVIQYYCMGQYKLRESSAHKNIYGYCLYLVDQEAVLGRLIYVGV